MKNQFVEAVQEAVRRSNKSIGWLAAQLNKAPSTLYDELNPFAEGNGRTSKLGLEDAVRLMELIGDLSPLLQINSHFNLSARSCCRKPNGKDLDEECLQGFQALGRFVEAVRADAAMPELIKLCCDAQDELEDVVKRVRADRSGIMNGEGAA